MSADASAWAALQGVLIHALSAVNDALWPITTVLLLAAGLIFTLATGAVQVRHLGKIAAVLRAKTNQTALSPFQAFCVSTGARVGVGNIAGISLAVMTGGPGAIFWMWASAFLGAATGFAESTAAQLYKRPDGQGGFRGGPAAYLQWGCGCRWAAVLFAVLLAAADGLIFNSVLANTLAISMDQTIGIPRTWGAVIIALMAAAIAAAGPKRLSRFSEALVPFMLAAYLLLALGCSIVYFDRIPDVIVLIVKSAFSPDAALGAGVWFVISTGVRRGLYSNEAGQGTVPNAAAAAHCRHPAEQGLVQAAGVYADTFIICTATAAIILLCPDWAAYQKPGIEQVGAILNNALGGWTGPWLLFVVYAFAVTSMIGNFFYSDMALRTVTQKAWVLRGFKIAVAAMAAVGALAELPLVWNAADFFMAVMTLINLAALALLYPVVVRTYRDWARKVKNGVPAGEAAYFSAQNLPENSRSGIVSWD